MSGPGLVCAGCGQPTSLHKPICDICMRAAGQEPTPEWQLELLEAGIRKRKIYELASFTNAEEFNQCAPIGSQVLVMGSEKIRTTRSQAWRATPGLHVVLLVDVFGAHGINDLQVVVWVDPKMCPTCVGPVRSMRQAPAGGAACDRCVPP